MKTRHFMVIAMSPLAALLLFWSEFRHGFPGIPVLSSFFMFTLPFVVLGAAPVLPIAIGLGARYHRIPCLWPILFSLCCSAVSVGGLALIIIGPFISGDFVD